MITACHWLVLAVSIDDISPFIVEDPKSETKPVFEQAPERILLACIQGRRQAVERQARTTHPPRALTVTMA